MGPMGGTGFQDGGVGRAGSQVRCLNSHPCVLVSRFTLSYVVTTDARSPESSTARGSPYLNGIPDTPSS